MSQYCPVINGPTLYLNCKECEEKECEKFQCLIIGSRSFTDYEYFKTKINYYLQNHKNDAVIISGGAAGTDSLAKQYAKEFGYEYKEFPAEWKQYGKSAGYMRNKQMHEYISHFKKRGVIAFWDGKSKGTAQSFDLAPEYNNQLIVVDVKNV